MDAPRIRNVFERLDSPGLGVGEGGGGEMVGRGTALYALFRFLRLQKITGIFQKVLC